MSSCITTEPKFHNDLDGSNGIGISTFGGTLVSGLFGAIFASADSGATAGEGIFAGVTAGAVGVFWPNASDLNIATTNM